MTLIEIRQKLRERPYNRTDLVTSDYADNGIDLYIKEAVEFLDGLLGAPASRSIFEASLVAGDYEITLNGCLAVEQLWFYYPSASTTIVQQGHNNLPFLNLGRFLHDFPKQENTAQGMPTAWTVWPLRTSSSDIRTTDATVFTAANRHLQVVRVMPPIDQALTFYVIGQFESGILNSDSNSNYWSICRPYILLQAVAYLLAAQSGENKSAEMYLSRVYTQMQSVDYEIVMQGISGRPMVMEG